MAATEKELKPVYYLYGKEDYLAEEAFQAIRKRVLVPGLEAMNFHAYEGDSCDPRDVIVTCETLPAFSEKRLVLVKRAEALNKEKKEAFCGYVKNPSPSTCLVFVSSADRVEGGAPFFKSLEERGFLRRFGPLYEKEAGAWIRKEASSRGKTITEGAVVRLMETAGRGLRDLGGELEKIILFAGDKKTIDESDVEAAGSLCKQETVFRLSDAIGRKDATEALKVYAKFASDPISVIGAVAWHMRALLKIKVLAGKGVPRQKLPSILGIKGKFDEYVRNSRLFSEEELREALKGFYHLDRALKSGGSKTLLWKLIIDLCNTRKDSPKGAFARAGSLRQEGTAFPEKKRRLRPA